MKTSLFLLVLILLVTPSCKKENDKTSLSATISTNMKISNWAISKFYDSGTDETSNFTGYNFTFNASGNVNASNGVNQYNGTWSVDSESSDDDSIDDIHFNLFFNVTNSFDDLTDDWEILSQTATKVVLVDVSGGGSGTDSLIFIRN